MNKGIDYLGREKEFWERVEKRDQGDCWPWMLSPGSWGYGHAIYNGKRSNASRVAYQIANGVIPTGNVVLHICDNRICCNPRHLVSGTQAENVEDCRKKGRLVHKSGACHHRASAKVDEKSVLDIRSEYAAGKSQSQIAREWNIDSSTVGRIVRNESWRHVR